VLGTRIKKSEIGLNKEMKKPLKNKI